MTATIDALTTDQLLRADKLREFLAAAEQEVRQGKRKVRRRIKVAMTLSERCHLTGVEGALVSVSPTGALITVRDGITKQDVEIPNADIRSWSPLD